MTLGWQAHPRQDRDAAALAAALQLHPLTCQLLLNRGILSADDARRFLQPTLETLSDPATLPQLPGVIARLQQAMAAREPVVIFGDSDVDGLTAGVMLYEVLQAVGVPVEGRVSNRVTDGYGLPAALVEQLHPSRTGLLILVDCGTNQPQLIRQAQAQGIDVLVIDHHLPLEEIVTGIPILNPRLVGGAGQEFCSAGLVFKVAQSLLGPGQKERLRAWTDLAALGTLADCSPLVGDNRIMVAEGLPQVLATTRPGLAALCQATKTTRAEPDHVLRQLVPRLNACGRMGEARAIWHLLRQAPEGDVAAWLQEAAEAHAATKALYKDTMAAAQAQVQRLHFRDQRVLVVARSGWHQGIMGPLAAQLAQQYGRPAIAIALDEERGVGSGRSSGGVNLLALLHACQESLMRFGGHAAACGLTVARKQLETFRRLINEQAQALPGPVASARGALADMELSLDQVETTWVQEASRLWPYGMGNPKPTVLLRQVQVTVHSPRLGILRQGEVACAARGNLENLGATTWYDAVVTPSVLTGQLQLAVGGVKGAAAPWEPGRTSDRPCTPASA